VQRGDPGSTLAVYTRLLAARRALLEDGLSAEVVFLDLCADVLAFRRGPLLAVLNTANEPVQVQLSGTLLEATADGARVDGGVLTLPAAAAVWLRN